MNDIIYGFEKEDKRWQHISFYEIIKDLNGNKILRLIFRTLRIKGNHYYNDWAYKNYNHLILFSPFIWLVNLLY